MIEIQAAEDGDAAARAAFHAAQSRRRPQRAALAKLVDDLDRGARVAAVRRLRGGISTRTFAVRYASQDGAARACVVRIYVAGNHFSGPEAIESEWKTLAALAETPVAAPRPLLLDLEGAYFGAPAMVVSLLRGGPPHLAPRRAPFLRDLAEALAAVHRLGPSTPGLEHLKSHLGDMVERLNGAVSEDLRRSRLGPQLWAALRAGIERLTPALETLSHDDFWPGNALWYRGRLTAVVDWSSAEFGDPRGDVAQCRLDLALMYGLGWADAFTAAYEQASASNLSDLWFWDLYRAEHALYSIPYFYEGYRDLGLRELSPAILEARLMSFIEEALEMARPAN